MSKRVNHGHGGKVDHGGRAAPLCWLFPPRCLLCNAPGADGRDLCAACLDGLPRPSRACPRCALPSPHGAVCDACRRVPPPLQQAHAVFAYAAPLDRLLPRLKFHRDFAAGRVLSGLMAEHCARLPRPQALVPLPLHRARLRQRGYDQALELARPLARALALPLLEQALVRHRATDAQSRLDKDARARNLRDAFAASPRTALPAHVALVDDVMTTGATLHAAARALHAAGVARVDAWVCARVG